MSSSPNNIASLLTLFKKHFALLLLPVLLFLGGAAAYLANAKPKWRATQSLQIRDELTLHTVTPGRFDSLDMMKMVQETIHDIVRRQGVVGKVLRSVEPPEGYENPGEWPTILDIENAQAAISLTAPNGAEFGRTEVMMLSVDADSVSRAKKIVTLLSAELKSRLNQMRDTRAEGIAKELAESVQIAKVELEKSNAELLAFEQKVGPLLIDLRSIINENGSGISNLQAQLGTILTEIRTANQNQQILQSQLDKLQLAARDPNHVLSFSSELLVAQPTLQRLKDQLIEIQSSSAKILGQFKPHHPKAKAALESQRLIRERMNDEIRIATRGLAAQVSVITRQLARLETAKAKLEKQIDKLADVRAPYAELVKNVDQKREVYNKAMQEMARANASRMAAKTTSLISVIDQPYSGSKPEGQSKKMVLGAAGIAGLLSGIGLVFFAASPNGLLPPLPAESREPLGGRPQPAWRREIFDPGFRPGNASTGLHQAVDRRPPNGTYFPNAPARSVQPRTDRPTAPFEAASNAPVDVPPAESWTSASNRVDESGIRYGTDTIATQPVAPSRVDFSEVRIGDDIETLTKPSTPGSTEAPTSQEDRLQQPAVESTETIPSVSPHESRTTPQTATTTKETAPSRSQVKPVKLKNSNPKTGNQGNQSTHPPTGPASSRSPDTQPGSRSNSPQAVESEIEKRLQEEHKKRIAALFGDHPSS